VSSFPIQRLLIANRGEISIRLSRACRELGIHSVAVCSESDAASLHVREADESVLLGGSAPADSYLNIGRIVEAALRTGCQAIHPGYGFLSENAAFARAVEDAGLLFIGPSPETLQSVGDKTRARSLATRAGVPVVPGTEGKGPESRMAREAERLGYPVLVKAAGGGGGRGMRLVREPEELPEALASARREAAGAFGDDRIFLEKYVEGARHVEFQILGDSEGRIVHLFERDCSVQRRHQKILEESPSPALSPELRARMGDSAVLAARAAGYRNAGTVEFLLDPASGAYYFLEVNARLQVEHPVTELLTGVDLVEAQLRIAVGEPLPFDPLEHLPRGHAMECRLYAEDPAAEFAPSAGRILRMSLPEGPGVRVDAGFTTGDEIPIYYDPMIAKIIVAAENREAALRRMGRALRETVVLGVATNLEFLLAILEHPDFVQGKAATDFLPRRMSGWTPGRDSLPDEVVIAAAIADLSGPASSPDRMGAGEAEAQNPWSRSDGFRTGG
jgi:3-methylcrotonyl-CoA carboxylase alpha subunit